MLEEILLPFISVFAFGSTVTLGVAAALYMASLAFGVQMTFDQFTTRMVAIVCLVALSLFAMGCVAPQPPCLSGFEVGVSGGQSHGRWKDSNLAQHHGKTRINTRDSYVGGHATAYFDTTGSCGGS